MVGKLEVNILRQKNGLIFQVQTNMYLHLTSYYLFEKEKRGRKRRSQMVESMSKYKQIMKKKQ